MLGVLCAIDEPVRDLGGQLLITVHDSLVFEIPKENVGQIPSMIEHYGVRGVAKQYPWLPVPFQWDIEVGPSYGELQSIESYLQDHPFEIPADDQDYFEYEIRQEFQAIDL